MPLVVRLPPAPHLEDRPTTVRKQGSRGRLVKAVVVKGQRHGHGRQVKAVESLECLWFLQKLSALVDICITTILNDEFGKISFFGKENIHHHRR